jgi:hypothetical protein
LKYQSAPTMPNPISARDTTVTMSPLTSTRRRSPSDRPSSSCDPRRSAETPT